jgi:toxin CptA
LLVLVHAGALGLLLLLKLPLILHWCLAIAVLLSFVHTVRQYVMVPGTAGVIALTWKHDGDWVIDLQDGTSLEAQLHASSYAHPWLVVLNFRIEDRRRLKSVVLFPDSLEAQTFRQLRVRLTLEGARQTVEN